MAAQGPQNKLVCQVDVQSKVSSLFLLAILWIDSVHFCRWNWLQNLW